MKWISASLLLVWSTAAPGESAGATPPSIPIPGVEEILFVVRGTGPDAHWYANFGKYAPDRLRGRQTYPRGASLCALDLESGRQRVLLEDPEGGIRDPQVHYDGERILFSYRPGGEEHYHLHEIERDGSGLRQLTSGPHDDIEPTYLPDGDIIFVSSRCKRWVNCWLTPVATMFRCDARGDGIQPVSANIEHDNTPWPLPDGRILYTRWEYIDRSQVHYHHLWAMNPDGTAQMTWFGNLQPGVLMIDAKPVPGSKRAVVVFSPGHGRKEHAGRLAIVDPANGPDQQQSIRWLTKGSDYRDPWAFSDDLVLAARNAELILCEGEGKQQVVFALSEEQKKGGRWIHEPRPLAPRPREDDVTERTDLAESSGHLVLLDAHLGRNMTGVKKGEIRKLLLIESLPKPINYTGGMEPLSYGGTFTLERVLGTVPVEPDGSAYFEVPARRSIFFVALDDHGKAIKRMQSFTSVEPGEVQSCVGCHEHRTQAPPPAAAVAPIAARREPSKIREFEGVPDILDFPRDIQPILDRHCVECHNTDRPDGGMILTGDRGPMYSHSYFSLTITRQFADGRNAAKSNYPPRALGSGGAPLLQKFEGGHYDVKGSPQELLTLRLWLDTGAPYPGTYAALGTGMIGGYESNSQVIHNDKDWPQTRAAHAAIDRRCASCHQDKTRPLPRSLSDECGFSFWQPNLDDPRIRRLRHIVFNLSQPDRSLMLLAPLAASAGGHGKCRIEGEKPGSGSVFSAKNDADYRAILGMIEAGKQRLDEIKRFDMPGFKPRPEWVREMKFYGVLPASFDLNRDPLDVYRVERDYWKSLHHRPTTKAQP
jgi:hypothetical protein